MSTTDEDALRLIEALLDGDQMAALAGRDRVLTDELRDALTYAADRLRPPPPVREVGLRKVEFVVLGKPVPQGSKNAAVTKAGTAYMYEQNAAELRRWRRAVRDEAKRHRVAWARQAPVHVSLKFMLAGTKRDPFGWCPVAPDLDKLTRAVLDGLQSAGMLTDDAAVVALTATKQRGATPGVRVVIRDVA